MGICHEIDEFANRLPVRIPGYAEPMVPVSLEEHQQMLRGFAQVKRADQIRGLIKGMSPDEIHTELGLSMRTMMDSIGNWSSLEMAIYTVLRGLGDRVEAEGDESRAHQLKALRTLQARFEREAEAAEAGAKH